APPYVAAAPLLVSAPTVPLKVPFKLRATIAVGVNPLRSNAAPLLTVTPDVLLMPLPSAAAPPSFKVPALTAVAPVKVLAPLNVHVPVPALVTEVLFVPLLSTIEPL